jgi:uncharacterized membrane protein YkoI
MKTCTIFLGLVAASISGAAAANAAPPHAKIGPAQAVASATRKVKGTAVATKYEFEDGHWQYAVTVKSKSGQLYEAEVSATTGKVTAVEKTTLAEERAEEEADKKAQRKSAK